MSSPLSDDNLLLSNLEITKLNADLSSAINTYSEVLSVFTSALAEKGSTVVSPEFVLQIINDGYKHLTDSFNQLQYVFNEYYNAITIQHGIDNS